MASSPDFGWGELVADPDDREMAWKRMITSPSTAMSLVDGTLERKWRKVYERIKDERIRSRQKTMYGHFEASKSTKRKIEGHFLLGEPFPP